jgi:hypothetical protein
LILHHNYNGFPDFHIKEKFMKPKWLLVIACSLLLMTAVSCNSGGKSALPTATPIVDSPNPAASDQVLSTISPAVTPANTQIIFTPTLPPATPPPHIKKLPMGTYRNIGEIADPFLDNFTVIGGTPPLAWFSGVVSLKVEEDGTISEGHVYFHIFTNYTANDQPCNKGEYIFESEHGSGTYDPQQNIITMIYSGTASFDPENVPDHCGDTITTDTEITLYLMHGEGNEYLLCKNGEQGDACLHSPMARLTP